MRMTPNRFEHLFTIVGHRIEKRTTRSWIPTSTPQRLTLAIHYLATGESQQPLGLNYCIGKSTVYQIVLETALAKYNCLKDPYMKTSSSKEEQLNILVGFEDTWNCPHCIGTIYRC